MSKKFKFKPNKPQSGMWSGRGIGIPVGGAIGGGDDYKQKIGRNKIPWTLTDFGGMPSQSADSGFSSELARVNKGYEEEYYDSEMFPDQVPEDEDTYDYGLDGIRDRKVPQTFKVLRPKMKGIRERAVFDENEVVKNSQYSLLDIPQEYTIEEILEEGMIGQFFGDLGGDAAAAALAAISGGTTSWGMVAWNIMQLKDDLRDGDVAIEKHLRSPSDETVEDMTDALDSMAINLIDLFQRLIESIPDPTPAGEITSFLGSILNNLSRFKMIISGPLKKVGLMQAGPGTAANLWSKLKVVGLVTPIFKALVGILDSNLAPESLRQNSGTVLAIPKRMILLSDLIEDYQVQKEAAEELGGSFEYRQRMSVPSDYGTYDHDSFRRDSAIPRSFQMGQDAAPQPTRQQGPWMGSSENFTDPSDAYRYVRSMTPGQNLFLEEDTMSKELDDLKSFIRETAKSLMSETVYEDVPSLHPPQPEGYMFRDVPTVAAEDDEEPFEVADNYDGFSVSYKTDGGVVNYQARSKLNEEKEEALRRIVRRRIKATLSESKKK